MSARAPTGMRRTNAHISRRADKRSSTLASCVVLPRPSMDSSALAPASPYLLHPCSRAWPAFPPSLAVTPRDASETQALERLHVNDGKGQFVPHRAAPSRTRPARASIPALRTPCCAWAPALAILARAFRRTKVPWTFVSFRSTLHEICGLTLLSL